MVSGQRSGTRTWFLHPQDDPFSANVYTHVWCASFSELKKYPQLITLAQNSRAGVQGHFQHSVVFTTNCLMRHLVLAVSRAHTTELVRWFPVTLTVRRTPSAVIKQARWMLRLRSSSTVYHRFSHGAVLGIADKIIDAAGRYHSFFVVMAAICRSNYDTITLFWPVFIWEPLVVFPSDVGQCNDAYGAVQIVTVSVNAVNDLPLELCWQWAGCLRPFPLHLGIPRNHRLTNPSCISVAQSVPNNILLESAYI